LWIIVGGIQAAHCLNPQSAIDMRHYTPDLIFVEHSVLNSPVSRAVMASLPGCAVEVIESADRLLEEAKRDSPTISRAKRSLLLARQDGEFLKACPGGHGRNGIQNVCCNYFVINLALNCHMDCSYCYLQSYLNFPHLVVYANSGDLFAELELAFSARRDMFFRVGTGQLADSLALDPLTRYSVSLVDFFARQPNAVLELKTKTGFVGNLLDLDHRNRTLIAWSVNSRRICQAEEHKTAPLDDRLRAAGQCVEAGYQVAFHFDPIVDYEGWEREYREVVGQIFDFIPARSIAWISLGALRMTPQLRDGIRARFPGSLLPLGELLPGHDGKLRYFKPIRIEMYRQLLNWIRARSAVTRVYTCMEKPEVWERIFNGPAPLQPELGAYLGGGLWTMSIR
jgi:spore photoproduct lyase